MFVSSRDAIHFQDTIQSVLSQKFTSVNYGVPKPEARSEAWVLFTSVTSSVQHEAMLALSFFSADRELRDSFMSEPRLSDHYL